MSVSLEIRREKNGMFAVYRDEDLLFFNLDRQDVLDFMMSHRDFKIRNFVPNYSIELPPNEDRHHAQKLGRPLILEAHADLLRSMLQENPGITAVDVRRRLRDMGVKFASVSAVRNLAKRHGLPLAA